MAFQADGARRAMLKALVIAYFRVWAFLSGTDDVSFQTISITDVTARGVCGRSKGFLNYRNSGYKLH